MADSREAEKSAGAQSTTEAASEFSNIRTEDHDIDRFGYKPELERRFGFWSVTGLACTIMVTWEGWFTTCNVSILNGGYAGSVWSFLFCWIGYAAVCASLAELISMIPTAGGQYHWTFELAPPKYRKFVSWITGWQIVCAWQADLAAVFYLMGTAIQGLVILNDSSYVFERWHGTLIIWGIVVIALIFNTVLVKALPLAEAGILVVHCLAFIVVIVPLLYFGPHTSAREVFTAYSSIGGYAEGTSWFVGLLTTVFAFLGADGAIHMCEEVRGARTTVPNALMTSVAINGLMGWGMVIAVMFTFGDLTQALTSETGFVFIDYFTRALDSARFATGLAALILAIILFATVAILASTSRVTWAFARDNGLPGSYWIKKVDSKFHLPLVSIFLSGAISILLSLINIGSAVAFNAIVSLTVASFFGSYIVPIVLVTWKRLTRQPIEVGPWNMGRLGLPVNLLALFWLAITWIFSFFPLALPVTAQSMNWSCLLWGFIMSFGVIWYFAYQRHRFTGPAVIFGTLNVQ